MMKFSNQKITLFVPSLRGGGAEKVMLMLAEGFAQRGLKVDLVLTKAVGPHLDHVPPSVNIVDLKMPRVLISLPCLLFYLRQQSPQVLLATLDHANLVALWAKALAFVPTQTVIRIASTFSHISLEPSRRTAKIIPLLAKTFYPKANHIVAVSEGVADDLSESLGISRRFIKVIYNPLKLDEINNKIYRAPKHPWFRTQTPVILGVGRLSKAKDFATLIRAFALLRQKRKVRLMILGEGEERSNLLALANHLRLFEHEFSLQGFVTNPYAYMARASVFALSSNLEGFPNVLVEAMACGTSVVATDCESGPREILEDGKYGRLVPVADPEALAIALNKTLDHPSSSNALRQRVKAFEFERIVDQYLDLVR